MAEKKSLFEALAVAGIADAPGGTAYFYEVGTTTLATIYSDEDGDTVASNPVTLDGDGRAEVYLGSRVRVVVDDASGTRIVDYEEAATEGASEISVDEDDASSGTMAGLATALRTSFGAADGLVKPTSSSSGRYLKSYLKEHDISLGDYSPNGLGSVDNTSAFNAAIADLIALGGGVLHIPKGTFAVSAGLTFTSQSNIIIRGVGGGVSIIKNLSASGNLITFSDCSDVFLEDVALAGSGSTGIALKFAGCTRYGTRRARLTNHYIGLDMRDTSTGSCDRGRHDDIYILTSTHATARAIRFADSGLGNTSLDCQFYGGQVSAPSGTNLEMYGEFSSVRTWGVLWGNSATCIDIQPPVSTLGGYSIVGSHDSKGSAQAITLGARVRDFQEIANNWSAAPTITDATTTYQHDHIFASRLTAQRPAFSIGKNNWYEEKLAQAASASFTAPDLTKGNCFKYRVVTDATAGTRVMTVPVCTGRTPSMGERLTLIFAINTALGGGVQISFTSGANGFLPDHGSAALVSQTISGGASTLFVFDFVCDGEDNRWLMVNGASATYAASTLAGPTELVYIA